MSKPPLYALDFDGVICDSALETSITVWKAAREYLWPKMPENISEELIAQFKLVRPALETGYEAILIIRLLFEGVSPERLLAEYSHRLEGIIRRDQLNIDKLKYRFGKTRDQWIETDLKNWLTMNPLFPGIQQKLASFKNTDCFIITTKQERFVEQILSANDISIPKEHIYGLDRQLSKQQVLRQLQNEHPDRAILFIEDRLPTLINVMDDHDLKEVQLLLADWGYNTELDKESIKTLNIPSINLIEFQSL